MPFVVAERSPNSLDKDQIERLCKEAWVAMNQDGDDAFKATDVWGTAPIRDKHSSTIIVKFFYCDRGEEFKRRLYYELRSRFGEYDIIQLVPTKTDDWFADPVWAVG